MEKEKEPTIQDVLDAVHTFAGNTQERFEKIDERFDKIEKDVGEVKENIKGARRDILDVGDRFVPRFEFDSLLFRVSKLEQKVANKH